MQGDIVERLREFGDWIENPSGDSFTYPDRIIHEAADEIERLRKALEMVVQSASDPDALYYDAASKCNNIARAALEGK